MPFVPSFGSLFEETFAIHHKPAMGRKRGYIILLPELWGVVPQVHGMAQRFANEGFEVYIPDILPGTIQPPTDPQKVRARYAPADDVLAMKKIDYVVTRIKGTPAQTGPVVVAGFCYGGRMALHAAAHTGVDAAICFYGTFTMPSGARALDPWESAKLATVPIQAHYGADDPTIPLEDVNEAARIMRKAQVFVYPGAGHAFMNETRDSYRPGQAATAWGRVLDFLCERVGDWASVRRPRSKAWEKL